MEIRLVFAKHAELLLKQGAKLSGKSEHDYVYDLVMANATSLVIGKLGEYNRKHPDSYFGLDKAEDCGDKTVFQVRNQLGEVVHEYEVGPTGEPGEKGPSG